MGGELFGEVFYRPCGKAVVTKILSVSCERRLAVWERCRHDELRLPLLLLLGAETWTEISVNIATVGIYNSIPGKLSVRTSLYIARKLRNKTRDLRSFEIRFDFKSNFRFGIRFVVMIRFEIFESSAPSIVLCKETIGGG